MDDEKPLKCFCKHQPLLATYGIRRGVLFVHVKVYKQGVVKAEIFVKGGTVQLRCRDCLRLHTVHIQQKEAVLHETDESTLVG